MTMISLSLRSFHHAGKGCDKRADSRHREKQDDVLGVARALCIRAASSVFQAPLLLTSIAGHAKRAAVSGITATQRAAKPTWDLAIVFTGCRMGFVSRGFFVRELSENQWYSGVFPVKCGKWGDRKPLRCVSVTLIYSVSYVNIPLSIPTSNGWPPEPKVTGSNPVGDA